MSLFKKRLAGVVLSHHKNTMESPTVEMPVPDRVLISMSQHMGPPCEVKVKPGDEVKVGTLLGDSSAFLSAPVFSSVSGKVKGIENIVISTGARAECVIIETDHLQTLDESIKPPVVENHADFVKAVRACGLVGLGGAGFPTHIKLNPKNLSEVDTLVINGAECEPYITADYWEMMENSENIMDGIHAIMKYLDINRCVIGVESNKQKAIEKFTELTKDDPKIEVLTLKNKYPQGAEKVIIYQTTGRVVAEGQLPADVGVLVSNVTTTGAIGEFLKTGIPLISKRITVDGDAIANPQNVRALIGTTFADIVAFCGGYKEEPRKLIMGGPMMGVTLPNDSYPLVKNNNALLAFTKDETGGLDESPCIRCGRCTRNCPVMLMPAALEKSYQARDIEGLKKLKINLCIECGCCSYVCPAKRNLVLTNRMAKKLVRESK